MTTPALEQMAAAHEVCEHFRRQKAAGWAVDEQCDFNSDPAGVKTFNQGKNMDIRSCFGSQNFIKAADLCGQEVNVTINHVAEEEVGQGRNMERKVVIYFQGKQKGLVCNVTNGTTIGEAIGYETDNWPGRQLVLFPSLTLYEGKQVPCLRVRMPAGQVHQQPQPVPPSQQPQPVPAQQQPATSPPQQQEQPAGGDADFPVDQIPF